MTRVIHTGDTHIGYQQYHSPDRRRDFLAAFEQVIDDAVEREVDAVVHAGDLFHDRRPGVPDLLGTLAALRRLDAAGVPFLAIVGNHEATRGGQWLDLFEGMGLATRLDDAPHVVGDVAFYGLDYVPRSRRDDLDLAFEPHDVTHAVLVAHGLFTPFVSEEWTGVWDTEDLLGRANLAFDALLLGDDHTPDATQLGEAETWVTYAGSTERASASEREGRGYNLVTFEDGETSIRRRGLDTRPFAFVEVQLAESEGVERVREQVRQHDLDDAVVIVEITGDGDPVAPASVEEAATEAGALIARVTDRREREAESDEPRVHFADPDEAVRERIDELGLSGAAVEVDRTVRGDDVADSNVRESVKTRVEELLDDDAGAFDPVEDSETGVTETADAAADADGETGTSSTASDAEGVDDGATEATDGGIATEAGAAETTQAVGADTGGDETDASENHGGADTGASDAEADGGTADPDESNDGDDPDSPTDRQGSMEDFL